MKDVVLFKALSKIQPSIDAVNEEEKQVYENLDIVKNRILGEEGKTLEIQARNLFDEWRPIREEVIRLVFEDQREKAANITIGKGANHVALLEEKMRGLMKYARKKASNFMHETEKVQSRLNVITILFWLLGIFTSIVLAFLTIKQVSISEKKRQESEKRYRSLVESQTDLICRFIPDGTFVYVNDAYSSFFKKPKQELIGRKWQRLPVDDDVKFIEEKLSTLTPTNPTVLIENRIFSGKGEIHWMQFINTGFFNDSGNLTEIQSVGRDITERRQAEEDLQKSEAKYRQIFETNKALKLMIDPEDGAIVEANEAACNYYGYSKREMETLKISDINALPTEKIHSEMQKAKREERLFFNFPHRLASGEIRNVEVYSGPVNLGKKTLLYSIIHDVTDRIEAEKEIREKEARYRLLFNSGNDAIFVHQPGPDGKPSHFIEVNEVACQMYGYTRDELMRMTPLDLVISGGEPSARKQVKSVLSGKQSVFENTHERKTGEELSVEISPHLFDMDGCPTILSIVRDITERKRAEKALLNQKAFLQKAQEIGHIGTWELDIEKNELLWTDENYRIFGLPIGTELTYETFLNCVHPDDRECVDKEWKAAFDKKPYDIEHRLLVDGEIKWVREKAELHFDKLGKCIRGTGFTQDITDRKKVEKALQAREKFFYRIIDQSPFAFWISDPEGTLQLVNPALKRLLNLTDDQLVGKYNMLKDPLAEKQGLMPLIRTVYEEGKTINFTADWNGEDIPTMDLKGSKSVSIEVNMFPIHDPEGELTNVVCNWVDITEKRQLEAQLLQSQKMEAVGTLAGGIAHDFNNILAIILGNAELAADDVPDTNPVSESLKEIRKASIRAKDMVRQLLAFSRKSDEKSKPLDMAPILNESMKMLRSVVPTSVAFKQHISDDPCNVLGDATQINQIVMNLVTNAADAMSEEGGLLEVILEKIMLQEEKACFDWVLSPGPYVRLKVRDTGEGIQSKIIDRIFDPYYTTKEIGKGTGMGLSVVHGIVKRNSGGIRVESELGEGTVFEIYFPALEKSSEEEKEPNGEIKGGAERILFVDDEESMVNLNRQRLERLGYQVKSTTKPVEALKWFKADPDQFDAIITDMTMPRLTGDRLAREVLKIRPKTPVIICTGYSERMSAEKAEALGVHKYIEKPIDLRNLASALREVLEEK